VSVLPGSRRLGHFVLLGTCLVLMVTSVGAAQRRRGYFGFGEPPKVATPEDFDGAFLFCRIAFRNAPNGDGNGWDVDYPRADQNLPFRLSELTKTPVSRDAAGQINHVVVRLTDPLLFRCAFTMMTEPGGAFFDEAEATALRQYVEKGGFLWADDFWGTYAFRFWADMIGKALPADRYPIVDVPLNDTLFHMLYDVRRIPQIPSINFWAGTGGRTSERGADSAEPHVRAILDNRGRIAVLMTHNTDFGDAFEREGDNYQYFLQFAPDGYAFGVNALLYAMTH
jgi:hypothetical protein